MAGDCFLVLGVWAPFVIASKGSFCVSHLLRLGLILIMRKAPSCCAGSGWAGLSYSPLLPGSSCKLRGDSNTHGALPSFPKSSSLGASGRSSVPGLSWGFPWGRSVWGSRVVEASDLSIVYFHKRLTRLIRAFTWQNFFVFEGSCTICCG